MVEPLNPLCGGGEINSKLHKQNGAQAADELSHVKNKNKTKKE